MLPRLKKKLKQFKKNKNVGTQVKSQDITSKATAADHPSCNQSSFRLSTSDALSMQVLLTNPTQSADTSQPDLPALPTHVVRLSQDGLRFNHSERFDKSQQIWLQLRLGQQIIVTAAEVTDSDSKKDHLGKKCFDTQVRFINTTNGFQSVVQTHIEDVVSKVCRNRREYTYVPGGLTHTAA